MKRRQRLGHPIHGEYEQASTLMSRTDVYLNGLNEVVAARSVLEIFRDNSDTFPVGICRDTCLNPCVALR